MVITYTPQSDFFGTDSFTYTVFDDNDTGIDNLYSNTATVSITVNAVNDAPVANDQNVSTDEDQSIDITIVGDDIDPDNLIFDIISEPGNGSAVLSRENASVTYTPNPNYNGEDQIIFTVSDGTITDQAIVSITVNPIDDTPIVTAIEKSMNEDESLVIELDGSINDTNSLVCNNNLSDNGSILCDCSSPALVGSCDIEGESLTYNYTDPEHGNNIYPTK